MFISENIFGELRPGDMHYFEPLDVPAQTSQLLFPFQNPCQKYVGWCNPDKFSNSVSCSSAISMNEDADSLDSFVCPSSVRTSGAELRFNGPFSR